MEVGSCFRDYDDFKESFVSFKKETKCHYGLRDSVTVRYYNQRNATYIREEITYVHVKFICVEPQSNNKKKKQLSNGCPAYLVLEYSEELDRLVIKEQNSNHVHVGLRGSQIEKKRTTSAASETSPKRCTSSLRKPPCMGLRQNPSLHHPVIKERNSNHIRVNGGNIPIGRRSISALQESTTGHGSSPPQKPERKRLLQKEETLKGSNCRYFDLEESHIDTSTLPSEQDSKPCLDSSPPQKQPRKTLQPMPLVDSPVIKEHNTNHTPKDHRDSPIGNDIISPIRETTTGPATSRPQRLQRKRLQQRLSVNDTCDLVIEQPPYDDCPASPIETNTVSLASKENVSGSALERVSDVIKDLLRVDMGSLASFTVDTTDNLVRLSFQTSKMHDLFTKFPESLLLHRVQRKSDHVLYAFLVESKERVGKVVHFSVLKDDTVENVSNMLIVFAQFNPEYSKVKVVFTDANFLHKSTLKEKFPTAQVLLSVYHTVRLIEKKVREVTALRDYMEIALREVIFSTSSENRKSLSQMLKNVLDPEFHQFLQTHWFSSEMLWYMHVKKGLHSCSTYMDSLQLITHKITSLFSKQPSIETSILYIVEYADCFNSKALDSLNLGFTFSTKEITKKVKQKSRKPKESTSIASLPSPTVLTTVTSLPSPVVLTRMNDLPSPAVLLPKLAQMWPKLARSKLPLPSNRQTVPQPTPSEPCPSSAPQQPQPTLAQPSQPTLAQPSQPTLAQPSQPTLAQPPQPTLAQPPQPTFAQLPQPTFAQPPQPTFAQPPQPTFAQPPQPTQPEQAHLKPKQAQSKQIVLRPKPILLLPKPAPLLPELLLPESELLLPELSLVKPETLLPEPEPLLPKQEPSISPAPWLYPTPQSSKEEDSMLVALQNICTEVGYQLCLGEWEVAKKSTQFIKVQNNTRRIIVKLLEDVQQVSRDCQTCSCYFNSRYRLPCRHILTILHTNKRPVEDDMVCHRWQRKYQQPSLTEEDILGRVRCSAISKEAGDERFAKMKSLSKELANLLLQCDGSELKDRCATLHSIVDFWKQSSKHEEDVPVGALDNIGQLPFLWVKQEEAKIDNLNVAEA